MPINIANGGSLLHAGAGAARTYPQSMLVWMRMTGALEAGVFTIFSQANASNNSLLFFSTSDTSSASFGNSTSWGSASTPVPSGYTVVNSGASLVPILIVATSNNDFTIYTPAGTTTANPNNPNASELTNCRNIRINSRGNFAEVASWNSALTAGNYLTLAAGAAPETVSPGTLYDVWDLNPAGSAGAAAPSSYAGLVNGQVMNLTGTATVSSYAHPVTRTVIPTLTGSVTLDNMAPTGSMSTQPLGSMSGTALLEEMLASGTLGLQPGTITTQPFKNWSGTLLPGATIPRVAVVRISDMVTVLNLTNQATNGSGVLSITSGSLLPGVQYLLVTCDSAGTAFGAEPYIAI